MTYLQIIIVIIILSGLLGGVTNFFLLYKIDYKSKECWINLFKSISLSLCASITVPLFLQIITNNLLDIPENGQFPKKNYLILAGFCVLAAFYSKRFLSDLYAKVNQANQTADAAKKIAENAEDGNQEIDNIEEIVFENVDSKNDNEVKGDIKKVVRAIINSKYSFRTISGIKKETSLENDVIIRILVSLKDSGFAESKKNKKGNDIWKIIIN